MRIYLTDEFNSALSTFRTTLTGYSERKTYEAARRVLDNVSISDLNYEIETNFSPGDLDDILDDILDIQESHKLLPTLDLGDLSGYNLYLLGYIDSTYMPEDQEVGLEDAYVIYLALTIMQIVTYRKISGDHLK